VKSEKLKSGSSSAFHFFSLLMPPDFAETRNRKFVEEGEGNEFSPVPV
jgi:hypothetical protein